VVVAIAALYGPAELGGTKMDWQIIASLVVSVGALLTYFAMGDTSKRKPEPQSEPRSERKIQGNYAWQPIPAPAAQIDDDIIDRFANALKAQSRQ
jgi:hypothetical protein